MDAQHSDLPDLRHRPKRDDYESLADYHIAMQTWRDDMLAFTAHGVQCNARRCDKRYGEIERRVDVLEDKWIYAAGGIAVLVLVLKYLV